MGMIIAIAYLFSPLTSLIAYGMSDKSMSYWQVLGQNWKDLAEAFKINGGE